MTDSLTRFFSLGIIGKTVPASKRAGVKSVLGAMKTILQSEESKSKLEFSYNTAFNYNLSFGSRPARSRGCY
jgi:hypothetical protein